MMGSRWQCCAAVVLLVAAGCASGSPEPPVADDSPLTVTTDDFMPFDTPPSIVKSVEPVYPEYARQKQLEGKVMVRVTVSARGKVEDARVVESSNSVFNEPALAAVRQFRFKAASLDGEAVRAIVMVPVEFRP